MVSTAEHPILKNENAFAAIDLHMIWVWRGAHHGNAGNEAVFAEYSR